MDGERSSKRTDSAAESTGGAKREAEKRETASSVGREARTKEATSPELDLSVDEIEPTTHLKEGFTGQER